MNYFKGAFFYLQTKFMLVNTNSKLCAYKIK